MEPNRNTLYLTAAIALLIGLAAGYFIGNTQGNVAAERKFAPILNAIYPPPPDELSSLTGTVKSVYGAGFELEIEDLDDYLPHLDGSARAKETRTANTSVGTIFTLINYERLDRQGNPTRMPRTFANLTAGDMVTVRSSENIRNAGSFDATAVEWIQY
jgi:hypothetical protein